MRDERIEQSKNKIYAEMMQWVFLFVALSFLVKTLYFKMDLWQCSTEYVIMITTPIYQWVRARRLGVVLTTDPKKAISPKNNIISLVIATAFFLLAMYCYRDTFFEENGAVMILIYIAIFLVARIFMVRLEEKRIKKLEETYDQE